MRQLSFTKDKIKTMLGQQFLPDLIKHWIKDRSAHTIVIESPYTKTFRLLLQDMVDNHLTTVDLCEVDVEDPQLVDSFFEANGLKMVAFEVSDFALLKDAFRARVDQLAVNFRSDKFQSQAWQILDLARRLHLNKDQLDSIQSLIEANDKI